MVEPSEPKQPQPPGASAYAARTEALKARVAEAARVLQEQGIRPTVTRIRAALGGGSPNDLAPALKHWRDSIFPTLPAHVRNAPESTTPPQITDLVHELWQRATTAALIEMRGGTTARQIAARSEETQSLRNQLTELRDQLQRESLAYGELRAQAARHEAMAREALTRGRASEARERNLLRDLGAAQQRIAELEAMGEQSMGPHDKRSHAPSARGTPARPKAKSSSVSSKTPKQRKRSTPPPRSTPARRRTAPRQKPVKVSPSPARALRQRIIRVRRS
jgi:hypothetical protein